MSLAQDDDAADDAAVTLTHTPSGGDYGAVPFASVTVTPDDDDTAGATVTPTALTVTEGSTGTYTVALATQPTAAVTVAVGRDLRGRHGGDRSSLTFSTSNWGTPQTVTVSLAQDDDAADDAAVTLTHTPSGGDYGAVPFASVTVTPDDDDTAGATVTPTALYGDGGLDRHLHGGAGVTQPTAAVTVAVGGTAGGRDGRPELADVASAPPTGARRRRSPCPSPRTTTRRTTRRARSRTRPAAGTTARSRSPA